MDTDTALMVSLPTASEAQVVNPSNYTLPLFYLSFGSCGSIRLLVWARGCDSALEIAAEWLRENAPGVFVDDDELAEMHERARAELGDDVDEYDLEAHAMVDHTDTGSGWIPSWEWMLHEVSDRDIVREAMAVSVRWHVQSEMWDELQIYRARAAFKRLRAA